MKVYFRIIFIKGNVAISVIFIASEGRWSFLFFEQYSSTQYISLWEFTSNKKLSRQLLQAQHCQSCFLKGHSQPVLHTFSLTTALNFSQIVIRKIESSTAQHLGCFSILNGYRPSICTFTACFPLAVLQPSTKATVAVLFPNCSNTVVHCSSCILLPLCLCSKTGSTSLTVTEWLSKCY